MGKKEGLAKIVGDTNVFDDEETLGEYSRDESFASPGMPWWPPCMMFAGL